MRRETRDVLTAWTIGLLAIAAMAAALVGCASPYPTEAAEHYTAVEMALVDHTARYAAQLGVQVRGVITSKMYPGFAAAGIDATAWYEGGVAYYYRPNVARWVSLVPAPGQEAATNIAAHEVAHAIYPWHAADHWCCTQHMGAVPTYPFPVAGQPVCEGVATRCLR